MTTKTINATTASTPAKIKKITATKKLSMRLEEPIYNFILHKAQKENRSLSNYLKNLILVEMDTTEYLLLSPKNAQMLEQSIKQANHNIFINPKPSEYATNMDSN